MNIVIETENLGKRYGDVTAVENLSLRVAEGEIYAFLGLNGAGKTTTIRMLLGMIKPTTGTAHVLHTRVCMGSRQPWAAVGYLVEAPHCYPELTVVENLEVARRLHPGVPQKAVYETIDLMRLQPYANRRAGNLSQGNLQRLGIAKALLHNPKLLLLDEPANGLDPAGIVEVREMLLKLTRKQGVTVFISSHILAEVSKLAQRVGVIHNGRLLQELNFDELERNRRRRLLIRMRDLEKALQALNGAGHAAEILRNDTISVKNDYAFEHSDEIASLLVHAGTPPSELILDEEDLEHYFLRLVGVNGG